MKSVTKKLIVTGLALATLFVTACATDISSNSYSDEHVGEAGQSFEATVVKVRGVKVAPDQLEKSTMGITAGGIGGELIGSTIGEGFTNQVATMGGTAAGAVGGAYAEKALKTQTGLEITVRLSNGSLLTVVQGNDVPFSRGEHVIIIVYQHGRSKVTKDV